MEYLSVFILIGVILYQGFINRLDREEARKTIQDLQNRLMAQSFGEYAAGTKRLKEKPDEPITKKERLAEIEAVNKQYGDVLSVT